MRKRALVAPVLAQLLIFFGVSAAPAPHCPAFTGWRLKGAMDALASGERPYKGDRRPSSDDAPVIIKPVLESERPSGIDCVSRSCHVLDTTAMQLVAGQHGLGATMWAHRSNSAVVANLMHAELACSLPLESFVDYSTCPVAFSRLQHVLCRV